MAAKEQLTINLFGSQGQRQIEVTSKGGLYTRHIKASDPNMMPSIFDNEMPETVSQSHTTTERTRRQPVASKNRQRVHTPQPDTKPLTTDSEQDTTDLQALLNRVDAIMEGQSEAEPTPAEPEPTTLSEGQQIIVGALSTANSRTLEAIARRTGLNTLYIMMQCRELAEMGIVRIESTLTARRYALEVS